MGKEQVIVEITKDVTAAFRSFGGGVDPTGGWGNPIAAALKNQPAQFAAGVDIKEVVAFVLARKEQIEQPGKN